jgi:hypothetical protein
MLNAHALRVHRCVHDFVVSNPQAVELDDVFGVKTFFLQQSLSDTQSPPV